MEHENWAFRHKVSQDNIFIQTFGVQEVKALSTHF